MSTENEAPLVIKKFCYPFPNAETSSSGAATTAEISNPQDYYDALALAEDGFFPIGYNGQWHGGIHFGSQTGTRLEQSRGIRCIADGEVIAWKIDNDYPTVEYDTCGVATYSTGFVLVRHRLALPQAPDEENNRATDENDGEQDQEAANEPVLLFYSLYIHLLNWKDYQQDHAKSRPPFWGGVTYAAADAATDADRTLNPYIPEGGIGLNLRNRAGDIVGFAPRGTEMRLGEQRATSGYYAVTEVTVGTVLPVGLSDFFAYRAELTPVPATPESLDAIVIPEVPIAVAAGELVGHVGQYQRYIDMNPLGTSCDKRPLAQIDVFTTDDIEAFITQSRARASQLGESAKTLLLIEEGARLVASDDGSASPSAEQLANAQSGGAGPVAVIARVIPIKALDEVVTEEDGTRWWNVTVGTENGESASGWVRERDHVGIRLCSPWDWPGFEIVRADSTRPDQFYANQVVRQGGATRNEEAELQQRASGATSAPIFRRLYDLMDLDDDKKIVSSEIRQSLAKPWLAQALAHLIVEHESEWSGPMDKWGAIDDLIPESRKKDWENEKLRIESLLWWSNARGQHGLPTDERLIACNLHPIGLIETFNSKAAPQITVEMLQQIFTTAPRDRLQSIVDEVNGNIDDYHLNSSLRLSHFFAQVREEIGNNASFTEGLNYSPSGLINTFSYFARNPTEAEAYGRTADHPADQEAIANRAYANRNGNGDVASGDGWRYRGRGLKMTTGRGNYRDLQDNYHIVWPGTPPDFVGNPELLGTARYAVQSAVFFWIRHGLYRIADSGETDANVDSITRIINRYTDSYAARRTHFTNIRSENVFASIDQE